MKNTLFLIALTASIGFSSTSAMADDFGRMSRDSRPTFQPQNWNNNPNWRPPANPSFAEQQVINAQRQRAALEQQARDGYSPNGGGMAQQWEDQWRAAHPGQPLPSFGQIEKEHMGEINANIKRGFANMRANRQAELSRQKSMALEIYKRQIGKSGQTLSASQMAAFDREFDNGQRAQANAYLDSVRQAGEIGEMQRQDRERREIYRPGQPNY